MASQRFSGGDAVRIVEVGPRDGLQNIIELVPTSTKIELIRRLAETGLQTIELTSVVSPRVIPQLADCKDVLQDEAVRGLMQRKRLRLPVLIPSLDRLRVAQQLKVKEIAVFVSSSDGFSKANINCTSQQGLDRAKKVVEAARSHDIMVRGSV